MQTIAFIGELPPEKPARAAFPEEKGVIDYITNVIDYTTYCSPFQKSRIFDVSIGFLLHFFHVSILQQ
jgi:hypothetical protein